MLDWLQGDVVGTENVPIPMLALRLIAAALWGVLIAAIYRWKQRDRIIAPTFPITLVLLSLLIAMVTQVVGDHVARAFSLVGALSIVRFRTVVEDTQDIAFVIFAVVVGMAVGTGDFAVAGLGTCVAMAVIAASGLSQRGSESSVEGRSLLTVRTALGVDAERWILDSLRLHASHVHAIAAETVRGGSAYEWTYRLQLSPGSTPEQVLRQLAAIEGIQSVSWKVEEK